MKFTIYSALDGRVFFGGDCEDPGILVQVGQLLLEGQEHATGWIENGQHHDMPPSPSRAHRFDWSGKQWVDPRALADLQDAKWEEVKRWRADAIVAPLLATRFGVFDADAPSMASIKDALAGLREAAALGQEPASMVWTMADNSYLELTPDELREVGVLLLARGNAAHERARVLREQVYGTTAPEQLNDISWEIPGG